MAIGYNTKQKNHIYKFLKENIGKHYTVDELWEELKKYGINIGKTTVYRFLEGLYDKGEVKKIKTEDNKSATYEFLNENCKEHYHLKCVGCGELIHTDCELLNEMASHFFKEHNFMIDNTKTVIYGKCERCGKEI